MANFKTKFDLEDTVYFLRENQILIGMVKTISVNSASNLVPNICYNIRFREVGIYRDIEKLYTESLLFPTMEALAENLIHDFEKRERA